MARLLLIVLLVFLAPTECIAQGRTGTCVPGTAQGDLDANHVRARVFNQGGLFYGNGEEAQYVVPKHLGVSAIYSASFWVGGVAADTLRLAAATYNNFEFWPGPLDAEGNPPADCAPYDRIYGITRSDLESASAGVYVDDVRDWPHALGAPVADGDGVEGNYDLAAGDRPALLGDGMLWWVMNDAGNVHASHGTPPVGLEVRVSAFAFGPATPPHDLREHTAFSTFYRYELVYRGREVLTDAYVGLYVDFDLGMSGDDYLGSDTTRHMAYVYNAGEADGKYGVPPAVGVVVLRGPRVVGAGPGMTSFQVWRCGEFCMTPDTAEEVYRTLRGIWSDGMPVTAFGDGYQQAGEVTTFMFPGDPTTEQFWSEVNTDRQGGDSFPGERYGLLASGPFSMQPGETQTFDFAVAYGQGADRFDSIRRLKSAASVLHAAYETLFAVRPVHRAPLPEPPSSLRFVRNHPNPAQGLMTFEYDLSAPGHVHLLLFDVLGRKVAVVVDADEGPGSHRAVFDASGLAAGIYAARFQVSELPSGSTISATELVVVVR